MRDRWRLSIAVAAFLAPVAAFAQGDFGLSKAFQGLDKDKQAAFAKSVPLIIARIIDFALGFVGVLFFLLMLYAGILWMTARGAQESVKKAKDVMTAAIVGLVIVAGAFSITRLIIRTVSEPPALTSCSECSEKERCVDVDISGRKMAACLPKHLKSGAACYNGYECPSGSCAGSTLGTCKTAGTPCWFISDCPSGDSCDGKKAVKGKCSEGEAPTGAIPAEPLTCPQGKACAENDDCVGTGMIGKCVKKACTCERAGKVCAKTTLCTDDGQCGDGGLCGGNCRLLRGKVVCACICLKEDDEAPAGKCTPSCAAGAQRCLYKASNVFKCE